MKFPVNLELFADTQHSPSIFALAESMKAAPGSLRDYCIPANPYFPTPEIFANLRGRFETILKFYPSSNHDIGARLAEFVGLDPETLVLGNGSTELISWINRLFVKESLAIPVPTFSRWTADPTVSGKRVYTFLRRPEKDFRLTPAEFVAGVLRHGARAAVLCNPNNPTGALMSRTDVLSILDALRDLDVVVIDESFIDFAAEEGIPSVDKDVSRFPNAIVLKSLGKNLGLHGLRMGYAVGNPELIGRLRAAIPFWNMNSVAQALIEELPAARHEYEMGRRRVVRDRIYLERRLRTVRGLTVFPAEANFVYVRMPEGIEGVDLRNQLLVEHGCLLRECGNKEGSDSRHFRIAARPSAETDFLIQHLQLAFAELGHTRNPMHFTSAYDARHRGAKRQRPNGASSSSTFPRKMVLGAMAMSASLFVTWSVVKSGVLRRGESRGTAEASMFIAAPPSTPAKPQASSAPTAVSPALPAAELPWATEPPASPVVANNDPLAAPPEQTGDAEESPTGKLADLAEGGPSVETARPPSRTESKRKAARRRAARQRRLQRTLHEASAEE